MPLPCKPWENADRLAAEDLKEFVANGRQERLRSIERSVTSARNSLAYQREELNQLEKMYAADDLSEETEEIILRRTRDAVESAEYRLQTTLQAQRRGVELSLVRSQADLERAVSRAALALEEARRTAPQKLERQRLKLEKERRDLAAKKRQLTLLRADRKQMRIAAPSAGVVYLGGHRRGKWSGGTALESSLQPGGSVKPRIVLMSIVSLQTTRVAVAVPEQMRAQVQVGASVQVSSIAFPKRLFAGTVTELAVVPLDGKFHATVSINEPIDGRIVPGMAARVTANRHADSPTTESP